MGIKTLLLTRKETKAIFQRELESLQDLTQKTCFVAAKERWVYEECSRMCFLYLLARA